MGQNNKARTSLESRRNNNNLPAGSAMDRQHISRCVQRQLPSHFGNARCHCLGPPPHYYFRGGQAPRSATWIDRQSIQGVAEVACL